MRTSCVSLMMMLSVTLAVSAQTAEDVSTTCRTLARLTEAALKENDRFEVNIYNHAAGLIRERKPNENACEAEYFKAVMDANRDQLEGATTVVSVDGGRELGGWTHREITELLVFAEKMKPSDLLKALQMGPSNENLQFAVDKLLLDMERLKSNRPDLFEQ
jgi:hypothetical protein